MTLLGTINYKVVIAMLCYSCHHYHYSTRAIERGRFSLNLKEKSPVVAPFKKAESHKFRSIYGANLQNLHVGFPTLN